MKNCTLLTVFMLAGVLAIAQNPKVINDANAQKRTVSSFHGIAIHSGIDLYLSQGDDEAVAVSASDPEVRGRIVTEVEDGILNIYLDDKFHWGLNWGNRKLKAYVSCKVLDQLKASGGSDVFIDQTIKSQKLELHLSGGSDLHGKFEVAELTVGQSGGADSFISGSASQLNVHVSGGSDFHGYDLAVDDCHAQASGGSDVYVTVNKELDATASGGSDIHYKGSGSVRESRTSGSGSVSRKD
ncbi:MAG TPA: head GIN domain-containing protein [Puia sp.]|nr:head GIN domain-containing protein [Puia sp.]